MSVQCTYNYRPTSIFRKTSFSEIQSIFPQGNIIIYKKIRPVCNVGLLCRTKLTQITNYTIPKGLQPWSSLSQHCIRTYQNCFAAEVSFLVEYSEFILLFFLFLLLSIQFLVRDFVSLKD